MKHGLIMLLTLVALSVGTARAASYDFGGCTVTPSGATVTTDNGELVITFTQSGSLSVSCDVRADILVVGGGGGGGGAYYSSNTSKYNGNGGNGGAVQYVLGETLASGQAMTVTVGAAGTGGEGVAKKTTAKSGVAGGDSSMKISSSRTILAEGGKGGAGGSKNTNDTPGAAGAGAKSYDISGTSVAYGSAGAKAGSSKATDVSSANGQGGQGGRASSQQTNRSGGKGGGGVVIVRLKEVLVQREPIAKPTAATGLTYDGTVQTGVAAGEHYTLGGVTAAIAAGTYTATATPANGYCWPDGTHGTLSLDWAIAKRPVMVSVVATNKVVGAEEPVYPTRADGFVGGDGAEVSWKVWRTNLVEQADGSLGTDESVGKYDLVVIGSADETANYTISYVNGVGAFEIRVAGPSMPADDGTLAYDPTTQEVVVKPDEGVKDVTIVDMPEGATAQVPVSVDTIKGVTSNQVVVVAEATNGTGTVKVDITEAFKITETSTGVTISLNDDPAAEVMVEIGGRTEAIKVTPELTATGDAVVEPLAVADDDVSLGAKTIPGLTYTLKRMTTLGGAATEVASETAKGTRTKLTDPMAGGKPAQAFYVIEVTK